MAAAKPPKQQSNKEPLEPRQTGGAKNASNGATPPIEWIVAGIGLALLLSVLVFLVLDAMGNNAEPPQIEIQVQSIVRTANGYRATFSAVNRGGQTAAAVTVAGEIRKNGALLEQSWVTLDYLPSRSEKSGGLFFTQDPRGFDFAVRAMGYETP